MKMFEFNKTTLVMKLLIIFIIVFCIISCNTDDRQIKKALKEYALKEGGEKYINQLIRENNVKNSKVTPIII